MEGLIVILLYAFKLAFLTSLACVRTKEFSLKSEVKKAYLHAHKRILIMPAIMKEVYKVVQPHSVFFSILFQESAKSSPKFSVAGGDWSAPSGDIWFSFTSPD